MSVLAGMPLAEVKILAAAREARSTFFLASTLIGIPTDRTMGISEVVALPTNA